MPYILLMAIATAVVSIWANLEGYSVWPSFLAIFSGVLFWIAFDMYNTRRLKSELARESEEKAKIEGDSEITSDKWVFEEKDEFRELDLDNVIFLEESEASEAGDTDEE